jgi:hypothetical protein
MNTFARLSTQYVDGKSLFNYDRLTSNCLKLPIITRRITSIPHHIAALRSLDDLESKVLDRQAWDIYHDLISIPCCNIHLCVKLTNQYITFIFFEMISATIWSVSQTSFSFLVYRKRNQIVDSSISVAFSFPPNPFIPNKWPSCMDHYTWKEICRKSKDFVDLIYNTN